LVLAKFGCNWKLLRTLMRNQERRPQAFEVSGKSDAAMGKMRNAKIKFTKKNYLESSIFS